MNEDHFDGKAKRLRRQFYDRLNARDMPSAEHLKLPQLWEVLRRQAQELQAGAPPAADALLTAMRDESHFFAADVFAAGEEVERVNPSSKNLEFRDVLSGFPGASMAVVTSTVKGELADEPRYVTHLGEKCCVVRSGRMSAEWIRVDAKGPGPARFEAHAREMTPVHQSTVWIKSRMAHRLCRKGKNTREIAFFSDARGPHAIVRSTRLAVEGFGADVIEPSDLSDVDGMWRRLFGIGARVENIRTAKGVSVSNLGSVAELHPSNVSRLESGERSPDLKEIVSLACGLDVPVDQLCPTDFDRSLIRGCFVWPKAEVDAYVPGVDWSISPTDETKRNGLVLLPVIWNVTGLVGSLCSSPDAKSLVAMHVYFGSRDERTELAKYQSAVGNANDKHVEEPADHWGGFSATAAEIAILCLHGAAEVEIQRWPESRLFPALAARARSDVLDATMVEKRVLKPDSLIYIRPRHAFRIRRLGKEPFTNLLCLMAARRGALGTVELLPESVIRELKHEIDGKATRNKSVHR